MGALQNIKSALSSLFGSSDKIPTTHFYQLRKKLLYWNETGKYSSFATLPPAISFSSDFWERVKEIYRHTTKDGYERAITVWWADGEFVLTESIRGGKSKVNIPKQKISVSYKPTHDRQYAERVIEVSGKVYSKRRILWKNVKKGKKIEVQYLFNMHTHPPHEVGDGSSKSKEYSFFSKTDIDSFLKSSAAITGLITDRLWLLVKSSDSPKKMISLEERDISPALLGAALRFKTYRGDFGRHLVSYDYGAA